jgi:hypothetical protein
LGVSGQQTLWCLWWVGSSVEAVAGSYMDITAQYPQALESSPAILCIYSSFEKQSPDYFWASTDTKRVSMYHQVTT